MKTVSNSDCTSQSPTVTLEVPPKQPLGLFGRSILAEAFDYEVDRILAILDGGKP
jgi:hypothetical protein